MLLQLWLLVGAAAAVLCRLAWWWLAKPSIYLLDFVTARPDDRWVACKPAGGSCMCHIGHSCCVTRQA